MDASGPQEHEQDTPAPDRQGIVATLTREGPRPGDALPGGFEGAPDYYRLRYDGVMLFKPSAAREDGPGTVQSTGVYYLRDDHTKAAIISAWLDANEATLDEMDLRSLHTRLCDRGAEWRDGAREAMDMQAIYDHGVPHPDQHTTCPFCDERVGRLPYHLPRCPAR